MHVRVGNRSRPRTTWGHGVIVSRQGSAGACRSCAWPPWYTTDLPPFEPSDLETGRQKNGMNMLLEFGHHYHPWSSPFPYPHGQCHMAELMPLPACGKSCKAETYGQVENRSCCHGQADVPDWEVRHHLVDGSLGGGAAVPTAAQGCQALTPPLGLHDTVPRIPSTMGPRSEAATRPAPTGFLRLRGEMQVNRTECDCLEVVLGLQRR